MCIPSAVAVNVFSNTGHDIWYSEYVYRHCSSMLHPLTCVYLIYICKLNIPPQLLTYFHLIAYVLRNISLSVDTIPII